MTQHNWEMDFEYDWVIKKRQRDELARLKLDPTITTGQMQSMKSARLQQNTTHQRMHSSDARTSKLLSPDETDIK